MKKVLWLFVFVHLAVVGCSFLNSLSKPGVMGLHKDHDFTYQAILDGGMAIGGVSSTAMHEQIDDSTSGVLSERLRSELSMQRETYSISPVSVFRDSLGQEGYRALLDDYQINESLDSLWLEKISSKMQSRYMILVLLRANMLIRNRMDISKKEEEYKKIRSESERRIRMLMHVYDLHKKCIAWSGEFLVSKKNQKEYGGKRKKSRFQKIIDSMIGHIESEDELYPYPDPPSLEEVACSVFNGFGQHMPENK